MATTQKNPRSGKLQQGVLAVFVTICCLLIVLIVAQAFTAEELNGGMNRPNTGYVINIRPSGTPTVLASPTVVQTPVPSPTVSSPKTPLPSPTGFIGD